MWIRQRMCVWERKGFFLFLCATVKLLRQRILYWPYRFWYHQRCLQRESWPYLFYLYSPIDDLLHKPLLSFDYAMPHTENVCLNGYNGQRFHAFLLKRKKVYIMHIDYSNQNLSFPPTSLLLYLFKLSKYVG